MNPTRSEVACQEGTPVPAPSAALLGRRRGTPCKLSWLRSWTPRLTSLQGESHGGLGYAHLHHGEPATDFVVLRTTCTPCTRRPSQQHGSGCLVKLTRRGARGPLAGTAPAAEPQAIRMLRDSCRGLRARRPTDVLGPRPPLALRRSGSGAPLRRAGACLPALRPRSAPHCFRNLEARCAPTTAWRDA